MIGGRRPILSDRLPTNGMTSTARMLPEHRDPQIDVLVEPDPVGGLHGVGGAEDRGHDGDGVHQRHADDAQHVGPAAGKASTIGALRHRAVRALLGEGRGLVDLAADDVAGDDHERR